MEIDYLQYYINDATDHEQPVLTVHLLASLLVDDDVEWGCMVLLPMHLIGFVGFISKFFYVMP